MLAVRTCVLACSAVVPQALTKELRDHESGLRFIAFTYPLTGRANSLGVYRPAFVPTRRYNDCRLPLGRIAEAGSWREIRKPVASVLLGAPIAVHYIVRLGDTAVKRQKIGS